MLRLVRLFPFTHFFLLQYSRPLVDKPSRCTSPLDFGQPGSQVIIKRWLKSISSKGFINYNKLCQHLEEPHYLNFNSNELDNIQLIIVNEDIIQLKWNEERDKESYNSNIWFSLCEEHDINSHKSSSWGRKKILKLTYFSGKKWGFNPWR